ncbi:MAG: non-heme iron oxygenase ferredoxin subunit [Planctomycetes bacterium]|nr:non-heme iron oxygenase ferredoxin subunit [Planctomycetota bacterium]
MPTRQAVADITEILAGQGKSFEIAGKQIALFKAADRYLAIDNLCPHRGGPLADGSLTGDVVTCPWHGWQFDCATGKSTRNAAVCVTSYATSVEGSTIYVEV